MLRCRGQYILIAGADGDVKVSSLHAMLCALSSLSQHAPVLSTDTSTGAHTAPVLAAAIGARTHAMTSRSGASRSWVHTLALYIVQALVSLVIGGAVKDTQCPFKMFTRFVLLVLLKPAACF